MQRRFWQSVDLKEFRVVVSEDDVEAAVGRLVQMARERGGEDGDNISVAVARLGKAKRRFRLFYLTPPAPRTLKRSRIVVPF